MEPRSKRRTETPDNLFNLMRVVAAATVLVYHAIPLTGADDHSHRVLGITFGTVALLALFGVSGHLVTASWLRNERVRPYFAKRSWRLFPGLVVCSFLTALVLGPVVTSLATGDYFSHLQTYGYAVRQSLLDTFNPALPGVFTHNPLPDVVNGSTWTLPVEVCCYSAVAVAGLLGALRRPRVLLAGLGLVALAMALGSPPDSPTGTAPVGAEIFLNALRPCGAFLAGSCLWLLRERIPRGAIPLALAGLLMFLPVGIGLHSAIDIVVVPYLVIAVGSVPAGRLAVLTAYGDVSYGVYIYAYPLQQTFVQAIRGITALELIAITLPLSWLLGFASWHAVERRAMVRKARIRGALAPAALAEPARGGTG